MVPHAVEREPDADDGGVQQELGGEAVHVRVLPPEEVDEDEGERGRLEVRWRIGFERFKQVESI